MRSPPPPAAGYYLCAVPQVRRLFQSVRGAAHSANNPGGCPASAQRGYKNVARAQTFLGHAFPEHAKGAGGDPPHAGVAGRILRLQFSSNHTRLRGRLLGGLLRRGLTSGRLLRGSRLCGRLLSSGLLRGGLTLDRALRALVSQ